MNSYKLMSIALIGLIQACNVSTPSSVATQSSTTPITKPATVPRSNQPTSETQIAKRPNLPAFCDRSEYKLFFEKFVFGKDQQGNDLRSMYTVDRIEVRDYDNPDQVLEVLRRQDDEFSINLVDTRWVQLVPSSVDDSPYTRLQLDIDRTSADTFRVNYIKAQYKYTGDITGTESEEIVQTYGNPGAYIFQHQNGCWRLTQKLQSTKNSSLEQPEKPFEPGQLSEATKPKILEGRYWIGGTGQALEVQSNRYRYETEGGEQPWRSLSSLQAVKLGVVYDGNAYWCLSTMKPEGATTCSERGWIAQ